MKTSDQPMLDRIDAAFDQLNSLLDHRGLLDHEPTLRAASTLRLEIVRALGDADRVTAAELTLKEIDTGLHVPVCQ